MPAERPAREPPTMTIFVGLKSAILEGIFFGNCIICPRGLDLEELDLVLVYIQQLRGTESGQQVLQLG
jgi:hypothetical protein